KLQRTGERSNTPTCAVSFKRLLGRRAIGACWRMRREPELLATFAMPHLSYDNTMRATSVGFSTDEKCPVFGSVTMRELFSRPLVRFRSGTRDQSLSP